MKLIKFLPIILLLVICGACQSVISGAMNGIGVRHATKFINKDLDKEIICIPYASKAFPWQDEKINRYLTKMKLKGYYIYRDGVMPSFDITDTINEISTSTALSLYAYTESFQRDSIRQRTTMLKQRKISGAITEWDCPSSHKFQFYQNSIKGRDDEYWLDLTLGDLINKYETQFGPISLSDYDYQTSMSEPYERQINDTVTYHVYEFVSKYRMENLVEKLVNAKAQKIIVVFDKFYLDRVAYNFKNPSYYGYKQDLKFKIRRKDLSNN